MGLSISQLDFEAHEVSVDSLPLRTGSREIVVGRTGFEKEVVSLLVLPRQLLSDMLSLMLTSSFGSSIALTNARLSDVTDLMVSVRPWRKPRVLALSYVAVT